MVNKKEKLVEEVDELDNWFGDEDDEEEQSADTDLDDDEESSPSDSDDEGSPDNKDQDSDAEEPALDDGTSQEPRAPEDPYEWVRELDPDLKAKVESLVHRDQSNSGRVAALQSRLDKMAAEQEARRQSAPPAASKEAVGGDTQVEDVEDDDLKEFLEEFPSVASSVQKLIEQRVRKEREEILGEVRPLKESMQTQQILERKESLRRVARDIFNAAETGIELEDVVSSPRWAEWLQEQPAGYQQYVRTTNDVNDAAKALQDFARWVDDNMAAQYPHKEVETTEGSDHASSPSDADKTAARRKAALQGSTPRSRSAAISDNGGKSEYEALFDEAVAGG